MVAAGAVKRNGRRNTKRKLKAPYGPLAEAVNFAINWIKIGASKNTYDSYFEHVFVAAQAGVTYPLWMYMHTPMTPTVKKAYNDAYSVALRVHARSPRDILFKDNENPYAIFARQNNGPLAEDFDFLHSGACNVAVYTNTLSEDAKRIIKAVRAGLVRDFPPSEANATSFAQRLLAIKLLTFYHTQESVWVNAIGETAYKSYAALDVMLARSNSATQDAYWESAKQIKWLDVELRTLAYDGSESEWNLMVAELAGIKVTPEPALPAISAPPAAPQPGGLSANVAIDSLRTEIAELVARRDAARAELSSLNAETLAVDDLNARRAQLEKDIAALEEKKQASSELDNEVRQKFEERQTRYDALKAQKQELQEEVSALQLNVRELTDQAALLTASNTQAQGLDEAVARKKDELDDATRKLNEIQQTIDKTTATLAERKKALDAEITSKEQALAELNEKTAAAAKAGEQKRELEAELRLLESQLAQARAAFEELQATNAAVSNNIKTKQQELTRLQETIAEQQRERVEFADAAAAETENLQVNKRVLEEDVKAAQRALEEARSETAQFRRDYDELVQQALGALEVQSANYTISASDAGGVDDDVASAIETLLDAKIGDSDYSYRYIVERPSLYLTVRDVEGAFDTVRVDGNTLKFIGNNLIATVGGKQYEIKPVI